MNLDPLNITSTKVSVTSNDILFLGCSFTEGVGVATNERYSTLLSKALGKNEINLALGGHGNYRSFDLFGQVDIEKNTAVVLQLSGLQRLRHYDKGIIDMMFPTKELLGYCNDEFLIYDLIRQLRHIINYCRAKDLELMIWSIARFNNERLDNIIEVYLKQFKEYIYLNNDLDHPDTYRVDNGSDGTAELGTGHPGPMSNKLIFEKLYNHYKSLYEPLR